MRLRSNDASDDQTLGDTEAEEHTVDNTTVDDAATGDDTTVQPTFTPAARQSLDDDVADDDVADDDVARDDAAAQTPTLVEPAESYPATYASDDTATPAASWETAPAASYETAEADETDESAVNYGEPVVAYTEVETAGTVEPADDYTDTAADEPAGGYETAEAVTAEPVVEEPVVEEPVTAETAVDEPAVDEPVVDEPVTAETVVDGPVVANAAAVPAGAPADLDQPLLSGDTELLGQWQRVQAEFVDDPQVAVAGAADLVEQAGQALVEALQQRQRQMRTLWDHSSADGSAAPGDGADTEQLRQMMQRYRALFNQLHQPV